MNPLADFDPVIISQPDLPRQVIVRIKYVEGEPSIPPAHFFAMVACWAIDDTSKWPWVETHTWILEQMPSGTGHWFLVCLQLHFLLFPAWTSQAIIIMNHVFSILYSARAIDPAWAPEGNPSILLSPCLCAYPPKCLSLSHVNCFGSLASHSPVHPPPSTHIHRWIHAFTDIGNKA